MKLQAHGQNVIIKPLSQNDETNRGEVVLSPWKNKMVPGTIVYYPDHFTKNFTLKDKDGNPLLFHVIWEPQIFCIELSPMYEKEVKAIVDELPDLTLTKEQLKNDTYKGKKLGGKKDGTNK